MDRANFPELFEQYSLEANIQSLQLRLGSQLGYEYLKVKEDAELFEGKSFRIFGKEAAVLTDGNLRVLPIEGETEGMYMSLAKDFAERIARSDRGYDLVPAQPRLFHMMNLFEPLNVFDEEHVVVGFPVDSTRLKLIDPRFAFDSRKLESFGESERKLFADLGLIAYANELSVNEKLEALYERMNNEESFTGEDTLLEVASFLNMTHMLRENYKVKCEYYLSYMGDQIGIFTPNETNHTNVVLSSTHFTPGNHATTVYDEVGNRYMGESVVIRGVNFQGHVINVPLNQNLELEKVA